MNVRLKFKKEGPIRFIGHLDLMRTFQKMFMRADIPIAYSEGFNPHQIFSFATALSVGVTSESEYMDLKLTESMAVDALIRKINQSAPIGIEIVSGVELPDKEPKAMAALAAASYKITAYDALVISNEDIDTLMAENTLIVQKKNKKGKINNIDLKPGIYELSIIDNAIFMKIATGSSFNVKPEQILSLLHVRKNLPFEANDYAYHRLELYQDHEGLIPLSMTTK